MLFDRQRGVFLGQQRHGTMRPGTYEQSSNNSDPNHGPFQTERESNISWYISQYCMDCLAIRQVITKNKF